MRQGDPEPVPQPGSPDSRLTPSDLLGISLLVSLFTGVVAERGLTSHPCLDTLSKDMSTHKNRTQVPRGENPQGRGWVRWRVKETSLIYGLPVEPSCGGHMQAEGWCFLSTYYVLSYLT